MSPRRSTPRTKRSVAEPAKPRRDASRGDETASERDGADAPPLELYRKKRDPDRTPEPFGGAAARAASEPGLHFVVQQHWARNMHFDLRLELEGVLKSWAVPKGPSIRAEEKRLAVHVEDHPLE